jgi:hypothetical protein
MIRKLESLGFQYIPRVYFLVHGIFQFSPNLSGSSPREVYAPLPYCVILTSSSP